MTTMLTRYAPRDAVPTRSLIDQLLEGSVFAPSLAGRWSNTAPNIPANLVETEENYVVEISLPRGRRREARDSVLRPRATSAGRVCDDQVREG